MATKKQGGGELLDKILKEGKAMQGRLGTLCQL